MTQTNSASLACFRGVARSFRYFQFRGERGEDAGIVSNAKYEPMTRATSQAEFQQRKARAKQGKKEQGTGIVKSYEPRAASHYISTSARATSQARRPLPREEGAITFISSSNFSRKPKCGGG
jgi:hypothetical protein